MDDPRFTHVHGSIRFCNHALTEISILSEVKETPEEVALLNGPPFSFYRATLLYCFNAEYTKLLEEKRNERYPDNHIASVILLNMVLKESNTLNYQQTYNKNVQIIDEITSTDFAKRQRELRNKKFSHADLHPINDPLKIEGLTDEEISIAFEHIEKIYKVINNCAGHFDFSIDDSVPFRDDRTRNFVRYHSIYKKYYHSNYRRAEEEGFGLRNNRKLKP